MDNFDLKTPVQPDASDLRAEFDQLRHLVVSVLILVIVMSGTFNLYLWRQWQTTRKDLAGFRPQATQILVGYQKVRGPAMGDFVKKLAEYAQSHPDFSPVLAKYGIRPASATNAPPASPTPAPATAPKK
jgi:hypothetical protein